MAVSMIWEKEMNIRIGIICPSEIAFRRFLPALQNIDEYEYIGVAVANAAEWAGEQDASSEKTKVALEKEYEKANQFVEQFGGIIFEGYEEMLKSDKIDAVYLPLPPALHHKWAKIALKNGKHVMIEKPSTCCLNDTLELIELAREKGLALHENYMFVYHDQLKVLQDIIDQGRIGDIRLYRINFGFPRRAEGDFRYNKALGGGALLDCGGYTLKYASMLLGDSMKIVQANLHSCDGFDVDIYGSAVCMNDAGQTVQIGFGMDNQYQCSLEAWGSKGILKTGRVLTAPAGLVPKVEITCGMDTTIEELPADDTFQKSLRMMLECIQNEQIRFQEYDLIQTQAARVDEFKTLV